MPDRSVLVFQLAHVIRLQQGELMARDGALRAREMVEWLSDEGDAMGEDSNDIWDFNGNNDK